MRNFIVYHMFTCNFKAFLSTELKLYISLKKLEGNVIFTVLTSILAIKGSL